MESVRLSRRSLFAAAALPLGIVRPAPNRFIPKRGLTLPLVVLDPGHGGKDPGAIGASGSYEKHVAFAAAQELRRQLEAAGQCRVALTRDRDVFIPLERRVTIAQRNGAALFVSMHADAVADRSVHGASVYTLSDAASDPQTAALAIRENSADRFGGPQFRDMPPVIAGILGSLVQEETRRGSARLARNLVTGFEPRVELLNNPARQARFMVLRAADVPSVLVEMGFMSNPADEALLHRPEYRVKIATALRAAIESTLAPQARLAG